MSIANRVIEATEKYISGDFDNCLIQICIGIDATAQAVYPDESSNRAFKQFIHDNMELITKVAFGGTTILNLHLNFQNPALRPDSSGTCSIQQILYHVVRCGLLHDGKLPEDIQFQLGGAISVNNNQLLLPAELLKGLILAVVASPQNESEYYPNQYSLGDVPFCKLAGQPRIVLKSVQSRN